MLYNISLNQSILRASAKQSISKYFPRNQFKMLIHFKSLIHS